MIILFAFLISGAQDPSIAWARDLDSAMARSAEDGRPVITYFTFEK